MARKINKICNALYLYGNDRIYNNKMAHNLNLQSLLTPLSPCILEVRLSIHKASAQLM